MIKIMKKVIVVLIVIFVLFIVANIFIRMLPSQNIDKMNGISQTIYSDIKEQSIDFNDNNYIIYGNGESSYENSPINIKLKALYDNSYYWVAVIEKGKLAYVIYSDKTIKEEYVKPYTFKEQEKIKSSIFTFHKLVGFYSE